MWNRVGVFPPGLGDLGTGPYGSDVKDASRDGPTFLNESVFAPIIARPEYGLASLVLGRGSDGDLRSLQTLSSTVRRSVPSLEQRPITKFGGR